MGHMYPIFLNLADKKCLVIGGGKVAQRKIETLLEYKAQVMVASPSATDSINDWAERKLITWEARLFEPSDLDHVFMVLLLPEIAGPIKK